MDETVDLTSGFASINSARIYYRMGGKGHPLILLHAGIADSRMWWPQISTFAQSYKVVTYDLRGYGKSVMPAGYYAHSRDLRALLNTLDAASISQLHESHTHSGSELP